MGDNPSFRNFKLSEGHIYKDKDEKVVKILTKDDYNSYIKKLINGEYGANKRNKIKSDNGREEILRFIGYCKDNIENEDKDKRPNVNYSKFFKYKVDLKLKIKKKFTEDLIEKIIEKSNKDERRSNYFRDSNMKKYYDDKKNKIKKEEIVWIYYLKIWEKDIILRDLFSIKNKVNINNLIIYEVQNLKENMMNNFNKNETNKMLQNLSLIISILNKVLSKNRENRSEWIKSWGEYYILVSLLALIDKSFKINEKSLPNPHNNKDYEIDFFISDEFIAIEIDGDYHKNKNILLKDKLKDIILEKSNIKIIRTGSNKECSYLYNNENSFYSQLCKFCKTELKLNKEEYEKFILLVKNNSERNLSFYPNYKKEYDELKFNSSLLTSDLKKRILEESIILDKVEKVEKEILKTKKQNVKEDIKDVIETDSLKKALKEEKEKPKKKSKKLKKKKNSKKDTKVRKTKKNIKQ